MSVLDTTRKVFTKIFGSRNERLVKTYRRRVERINALEPEMRPLTDPQLAERTAALREQISQTGMNEEAMYEGMAILREAIDRNIGIRNIFNPEVKDQFDVAKLPADAQKLYAQTAALIENTPPATVLGSEQPVESWLMVDIDPKLYEAVREIYPESRPPFRTRPFDVQLIGGTVLGEGKIAEMKTGEGKTIVAPLACFLAVLEGMQCHVVTVSDYHVQRDRDWVFPAFNKLGIHVGAIHPFHMQPPELKMAAYHCDIVYGTNSEFGFDYLRDNMKLTTEEQVQKERNFCIVDEIDSILIDEARTPLIISGPARDDAPQYVQANKVAEQLAALQRRANQETGQRIRKEGYVAEQARRFRTSEAAIEKIVSKFRDLGADFLDEKEADQIEHLQYYVVKREQKQAAMTATGVEEAQKIVGTRFYVVGNDMGWDHLINNALRAHAVYEKDREYVVRDGEVVIVDEFTGRLMIGRQWSDGLHQAVEAKEARHGVKIKQETQTLATITLQNFFKLYDRLAGMTGTAITEATEFMEIYGLDVICIPTNRPVIRNDQNDLIFLTEKAKWNAIVDEIKEVAEAGRPVLVGTTSVEKSQALSQRLTKKHGLDHEVLNAKQHEREAHIVANAGQQHEDNRGRTIGNVTISTNMAGRGTDIRLSREVYDAGGLHIVGTERHESRRIDDQLRGRAGRQGDPGSSRFFISMEDDLMKMFAGKTTMKALGMLGMKEDDAIEHRWITKSVERAQRKVEERNFEMRKNVLEYDEVMEYQRHSFYGTRQAVLEGREIQKLIFGYIAESIEDAVGTYLNPDYAAEQAAEGVRALLDVHIDPKKLKGDKLSDVEHRIRTDAKSDVRQQIETSLGEYLSSDIPPEDWDTKGLSQWAMSRFQVDLKQSHIRQSNPDELGEELTNAAFELIDRRPLDSLEKFYEKDYAARQLSEWVEHKFAFEVSVVELAAARSERLGDAQQRVAELIFNKAQEAYRKREIEYPVQFILDMAFGAAQQGADAGAWAADQLAKWANARYALEWDAEQVGKRTGDQLHEELREAATRWAGPSLTAWLDHVINVGNNDPAELSRLFAQRWQKPLDDAELGEAEDKRAYLEEQARQILRTELTQLERYVLLQILDQTWKDHLYAMDQLKDSVGLRGFGEKDPKLEFKREGSRMFTEMLQLVRDKVTDMIYRARLTANVQMRNAYEGQQAQHETRQSTGVSARDLAQGSAEQREDLAAAERAGGGEQVVQTIKRAEPKVGRNDPCPCGSGKKYKKCCGKEA
jgi:preprotein translocase subunit SecA